MVDTTQHGNSGRNLARLSISSASTTSSGASSMVSRAMSCSSPESCNDSSPPFIYTPLPTPTTERPVTKIEELDDDADQLMNAPPLPSAIDNGETPAKRGRGRPRKHPVPPLKTTQKVTKGRSKTGCITCRRRKKKCDETKPECNNCVKNSVVCQGYPEKTVWQPGRQKNEVRQAATVISRSLPTLVDGLETRMDQYLLDHFTHRVSRILTLFDDESNPFHDYLLPLAMRHRALMHSLLALSSSHLANTNGHHPDYEHAQGADSNNAATALILCLDSIAKGDTSGEYRPHLDAARHMLGVDESQDDIRLRRFLYEFFAYHDVASSITIVGSSRPGSFLDDYPVPAFIMQPEAGAMLGVLDGLFRHMSKITVLRNQIRERRAKGIKPSVDYKTLGQAVAIDNEIHEWQPAQPPNTARYVAAQLYRQCTWVYLYRTIMPSEPSPKILNAVESGLEFMRLLPEQSGTQSILLMPLFLLGCAAFNPDQRPEISQRFRGLHEWSSLGNILPAHEVVQKIWSLMDAGDEEATWDWERLMVQMGFDFLVT
ncbi:fungal-specific transcription factor domain-containing protein [Trichophaea hybrida]|nr:fungal-specific transcription factor domain-containing protein [Trichophaea hybrida]